jgi:hypothetical protein
VIRAAASFSYVFEVGDDSRGPFQGRVTDGFGECLLGPAPEMTWTEHTPAAWKLYARVELKAMDKRGAAAAGVSFVIDRGLMKVLRPGDHLYVAALPALGLSIVHDDFLVAAAGPADVLARVPLGSEVDLRYPGEDLERRFFKQPEAFHYFMGGPAPRGKPFVEIAAGGETCIMPWGRPTMGPFELFVRGSARPDVLLLSIERLKVCPETSAHTSAQLMDRDGYEVVEWDRAEGLRE